jgi:hypothetical protein
MRRGRHHPELLADMIDKLPASTKDMDGSRLVIVRRYSAERQATTVRGPYLCRAWLRRSAGKAAAPVQRRVAARLQRFAKTIAARQIASCSVIRAAMLGAALREECGVSGSDHR